MLLSYFIMIRITRMSSLSFRLVSFLPVMSLLTMMRGMQLVRPGAFSKTSDAVSSILRNTSCSHGWLRLVVQLIFAVIIVISFVLIVYMAIHNTGNSRPPPYPGQVSRCLVNNCRVSCDKAPFYGDNEIDIIDAVMDVEASCTRISLALKNPTFTNGAIPVNWLSGLRKQIHELVITRGNLMRISPDAFMSQFSGTIQTLVFFNITINELMADSLVGLSSLKQIYIKESNINDIRYDALRAVDDTLEVLTITGSGRWDPANVTGSSQLINVGTVDFSGNDFHNALGRNSFTGIESCKVLYLNSCRISSIGHGAFDHLLSIKMLFLNNNFLVRIPSGLFANIATLSEPKPRINLQDNSWFCDCESDDIRQLVSKEMLVIDPVCHYPKHFKGKTFSEFQPYCKNNTGFKIIDMSLTNVNAVLNSIYVNGTCYSGNETAILISSRLGSSFFRNGCSSQSMLGINTNEIIRNDKSWTDNGWLKFTFFLQTDGYSIVQVGSSGATNYGLVWYESTCPNELFCLDTVPNFLRMYNVDLSAEYIFCPILLSSGEVENDKCVAYNLSTIDHMIIYSTFRIALYVVTVIVCLMFGAICVYALILKNPHLLKGSKRILFVKHKTVDALVLPPKVPIRNDLINEPTPECSNDKIYVVPGTTFLNANFNRQKSTRSERSNAPSYVSAHQPTDDQLAEWRIKHFNNDLTITSFSSELSTYSWIQTGHPTIRDVPYHSIDAYSDKTYESLK